MINNVYVSPMSVFCINGIALAGKDEFTRRVKELASQMLLNSKHAIKVETISTIDPIKEIYHKFYGWEYEKTDEHRKNLNTLKKIWRDTFNGPMVWVGSKLDRCRAEKCNILFVMVREFDEMMRIKELATDKGFFAQTILITRDGLDIPPVEQEFLDSHPKGYKYDISIFNPTSNNFPNLPILDSEAYKFIVKESGLEKLFIPESIKYLYEGSINPVFSKLKRLMDSKKGVLKFNEMDINTMEWMKGLCEIIDGENHE
jgi:hypothetical protein